MAEEPASKSESRDNPLADIPTEALEAELKRRQRHKQTLQRRRERLVAEADKLREEIEALDSSVHTAPAARTPRTPQPRSRNALNLVEALKGVMAVDALSVNEATKRVSESGYRSKSPSFRQIVNQTLAKSDQFERVGRGLYKAK